MVFMTIVAAIVAFIANYPFIALTILAGTVWVMSGPIVDAVIALEKPRVYVRYPILAIFTWFLVGTLSLTISGILWWGIVHANAAMEFWSAMIFALLFSGFAIHFYRLLWVYGRRNRTARASRHSNSDSSVGHRDVDGEQGSSLP